MHSFDQKKTYIILQKINKSNLFEFSIHKNYKIQ